MPSDTIERDMLTALNQYERAETSRARAGIEERLWMLSAEAGDRNGRDRRTYLHDVLGNKGGGPAAIENRRTLLHAPAELWDRVHEGMPVNHAISMWRRCKHLASDDWEKAVHELLVEYDAAKGRKRPVDFKNRRVDGDTTRVAWNKLRVAMAEVADAKFKRVKIEPTPEQQQNVLAFMDQEIKSLINAVGNRINGMAAQAHYSSLVSRSEVLAACRVLSMDAPSPNTGADLVLARTRKRRLAAAYHPDKVGVNMRAQYQAVIEAFNTLETYNQQIALKPTNGDDDG